MDELKQIDEEKKREREKIQCIFVCVRVRARERERETNSVRHKKNTEGSQGRKEGGNQGKK